MELIDFILHFDEHLSGIIQNYGTATYLILFSIIFAETGLVVTPFLPGDSMIFVAATFAGQGALNVWILWLVLSIAAISGDSFNYAIGSMIGKKAFDENRKFFIKKEYLQRTQKFYEDHGRKTIILARFIPIIRTFAPFVAGTAQMNYRVFLTYNVAGGPFWVSLFTFGGYFFGGLEFVQKHFELVIILIIIISLFPPIFELLKKPKKS